MISWFIIGCAGYTVVWSDQLLLCPRETRRNGNEFVVTPCFLFLVLFVVMHVLLAHSLMRVAEPLPCWYSGRSSGRAQQGEMC